VLVGVGRAVGSESTAKRIGLAGADMPNTASTMSSRATSWPMMLMDSQGVDWCLWVMGILFVIGTSTTWTMVDVGFDNLIQ